MLAVRFRIPCGVLVLLSALSCWGASFDTVVPVNGAVSDIALDERRNVVWAANFGAYRVEQVDIATRTLLTPLTVPMPPSAVALSPNRRFLVVGEYQKPDPALLSTNPFAPETGGYTLFDLDADDKAWQELDAPQRRRRTLEAVKRMLVRESQVQPLLLMFEDLHWIDEATQTLLDSLVESLPAARILLLVTYRPEYLHHWANWTYAPGPAHRG